MGSVLIWWGRLAEASADGWASRPYRRNQDATFLRGHVTFGLA